MKYYTQVLLLFNSGASIVSAYVQYLADNGNYIKLNEILANGTLPSVINADNDTLLAGDIEVFDNENWIDGDGYFDIGLASLEFNSKTYLFGMIPNDADLTTTAYYLGRLQVDANNQINLRTTTTAGQFLAEYIGQSTSETIAVSDLTPDKIYWGALMIPGATEDALLYLNGLYRGAVTLANAVSGADIANTSTAWGASDTSGSNKMNGRKWEMAISSDEQSGLDIRKSHLTALGETVGGHHTRFGVEGDGVSAHLSVPADGTIDNIWTGGGGWAWEGVCNTYVSGARLMDKRDPSPLKGSALFQRSNTGSLFGVDLFVDFSTGVGRWRTDDVIELGEPFLILAQYNSNSVSNDPTLILIQSGTTTTLTVGDGLTEITTPTGTADDDSAKALTLLSSGSGDALDGVVYQCAVFDSDDIDITDLNEDWSSLSPVAYWKMGDYEGTTNYDNIDTSGTGTIYDVSGNGNDASANNMTHANLVESRNTEYETYLSNVDGANAWNVAYYGYGAGLRLYGGSAIIGTNTARNGEDYLGNGKIAFGKTANSYADMYNGGAGQLTGTIPGTMSIRVRFSLVNYADNADNIICRIEADSNNLYELKKNSSNQLEFEHIEDGTSVSLTHTVSGLPANSIHDVVITITPSTIVMYLDGTSVDSDSVGGAPSGSIALAIIGADTLTPTNELDGDILEAWFDTDTAIDSSTVSTINGYLGR